MKNSQYWEQRFIQLNEALHKTSVESLRDLEKEYLKASAAIQKDIEIWLRRLAANNQISLREAKRLLREAELEEFHWTVFEYIEKGEAIELDPRWLKQLENASARVHISRYEALLIQIQHNLEALAAQQNKIMTELNTELLTQGYYRTIYEVQKGLGQGLPFATLKPELFNMIASKPWAFDGKNFSTRIWENKERLINELQSNLTQALIKGEAPDKTIAAISDTFGVSRRQAGRLVMTEAAYFGAEGQRRAYQELDIERYEIVATLDSKTSEICQELDGEVLDMKDYQPGLTAPPFHPWCRTVTAPFFEDNYTERVARGAGGKVYYVDGKMTYKEWYEKYVKSNPQAVLAEKIQKNRYTDQKQYENYKAVLGREGPKSFEEFQNWKYQDAEKYEVLKRYYADEKRYGLPEGLSFERYRNNINGQAWRAVDFAPGSLERHSKHLKEYGNISLEAYRDKAITLLNTPVGDGIEGFTNKNGHVFRYDSINNDFASAKPSGIVETLFKPKQGRAYWERQIERFGGDK
jgi:SPP1 gp7 family putative phage head morphogenesis protein